MKKPRMYLQIFLNDIYPQHNRECSSEDGIAVNVVPRVLTDSEGLFKSSLFGVYRFNPE